MRSDQSSKENNQKSDVWREDQLTGRSDGEVDRVALPSGRKTRMSFSGHERNKLFLNLDKEFKDLSGISGLDSILDSRNIAVFDYNHDGFQDFLVANTNGQVLQLFQNRIPELLDTERNFIAVRFRGGAGDSVPVSTRSNSTESWTNRDGVGARVLVDAGDLTIERELRCGEGFAAQNSNTLIIGTGSSPVASKVTVVWPTGKRSVAQNVQTGSLITFYEDEAEFPEGFKIDQYEAVEEAVLSVETTSTEFPIKLPSTNENSVRRLTLVTSMATWCTTCRSHIPEFSQIQEIMGDRIAILAIPIDKNDTAERLKIYMDTMKPAYDLLKLEYEQVVQFQEFIEAQTGSTELPSAVLLDADNNVLETWEGVPTLSDLLRHLETAD